MKCPKCSRNHKYADGMNCECGYHFTMDPKKDQLTDGKFLAVIRQASRNDTYYFTANQLYTAYCNKLKQKGLFGFWVIFLFSVGILIFGIKTRATLIIVLGAFFALTALWVRVYVKNKSTRQYFDSILRRWLAEKKIPRLLQKPTMQQPPPEWNEKDIFDYGVERILVVQHELMVDLLVKNNFHTERSCLVVAANGYPVYISKRLPELVKANPAISIFFLHDASQAGSHIAEKFKWDHKNILEHAELLDLGLFQQDVKMIKAFKFITPHKEHPVYPVDAVMYPSLAMMVGDAVISGVIISTLLIRRSDSSGSDTDGGGYG